MSEQMFIEVFGDDEELTFNLNPNEATEPIELHVTATSGETSVKATSRSDIQVWLEIEGRSSHHPVVTARWDGTRLDIQPARGSGIGRVLRGSAGYSVRIEVPRALMPKQGGRGIIARLTSASGEVSAAELAGDLRLSTASGDLSLVQVAGLVEGRSASGDISIDRVSGQLRVNSVSGDVSIENAILDRWEINTVSGSIDSRTVLTGTGPYRANLVSGDAELRIGVLTEAGRPDAFTLESTSMSGDLEVEGLARKLGRRRWHLGSGEQAAGSVRLTTVSGDASVTVETAAIDGDFRTATGSWTSRGWGVEPETIPPEKSDPTRDDVEVDIRSNIGSALGKVDWNGINRSVNDALDSAFARPAAPAAPIAPTPPEPFAATGASGARSEPIDPVDPADPTDPADPADLAKDDQLLPEPIIATSPAQALTDDERRLEILRRIERGELSVEDGMAQLDSPSQPRP